MTRQAPAAHGRFPRWMAIVLLGPLVGSAALFVLAAVLEPPPGGLEDMGFLFAMVLFFGWMVGLLPAIMAAALWCMLPPDLSFGLRALASLVIGSVCGLVGSVPGLALFGGGLSGAPFWSFVLLAFAGAVGLAATALPGTRR